MPEEEKPSRPKLIVPGAESAEKKAKPVVAQEPESAKAQVIVPQSASPPKNKLVVEKESGDSKAQVLLQSSASAPESRPIISSGEPDEVPLSAETQPQSALPATHRDSNGSASPKVLVSPMVSSTQVQAEEEIEAGEDVEDFVDVGPAPEEDGIADIVGDIGVAEGVIAGLDEAAEREERARIAEEQRVRAIQEANARAEEEQRAREEAQRLREEEEVRAASRVREHEGQPPFGHVVQAQSGYPQQGHPGSHPGYAYPGPPQGTSGEGMPGAMGVQLKPPSGIPGWALYLIGFLSGALILLILFMATPMGEGLISKSLVKDGWRAPVKKVEAPPGR